MLPYPLIVLTLAYIGFSAAVLRFAPDCIHQPCNSEGIDNTTAGWATDFFIGVAMLGFALHLSLSNRRVDKSAIRSQIYMGLAFVLGGFAHLFFPNSGAGDGYGMLGFYIFWGLGYLLILFSIIALYKFVVGSLQQTTGSHGLQVQNEYAYGAIAGPTNIAVAAAYDDDDKEQASSYVRIKTCGCCDAIRFLKISIALSFLCIVGILAGCFWCSVDASMRTRHIIDNNPDFGDDQSDPVCVQLIYNSEYILFICFGLFWIPCGKLLRVSAEARGEESFWGISNVLAAVIIPISQWTIGFVFILYVGAIATVFDIDPTQFYQTVYGAVVYHYGVMVTFYLTHNLSYTLAGDAAESHNDQKLSDETKRMEVAEA